MTALRNQKRERFALERSSGKPRMEAMALAGYVPAEANARKLDNAPDIKARVAELYRLNAEFLSADIARVVIEQSRIAYANMADFWESAEDGSWKIKDLSKLPREVMAAVREVKIGKDGLPHIKLHDKAAALLALQHYLQPPARKADADDADDDVPVEQVARWDEAPTPGARAN